MRRLMNGFLFPMSFLFFVSWALASVEYGNLWGIDFCFKLMRFLGIGSGCREIDFGFQVNAFS